MASPTLGTSVPGVRTLETKRAPASPVLHVDLALLGAVVALVAFGLVMIYASSRARLRQQDVDSMFLVQRQVIFLAVGVVIGIVVLFVDYRRWQRWAPAAYVITVLALAAVLVAGTRVNGAKGWFYIGSFQIQPAEYAKPVLIVTLAMIAAAGRGVLEPNRFLTMLVVTGIPLGLLVLQPDLGTSMVYCAMLLAILLVAGARIRQLVLLAVVSGIVIFGALQLGVVKDYQLARLQCFISAEDNASDACYNLHQSQIAIGSGGIAGKGLLEGTQTNGTYVPEQHTDFIFTAVGEELGFLGCLALILLYALLVWRGIRIALLARDDFGTLVATGITSVFAFQAFLNIGVTIGVMPITGVTLPFVSYGGSSVLTSCIMVAMLLDIHMRRVPLKAT